MTGARLASGFGDPEQSPGLLLWRVTHDWQAAMRRALAPLDLTHVQYVLLASLAWLHADGPVRQRDLAEHARTDPMMTSQVLRALEAKGLVARAPHPTDGRARALGVTPTGAALADSATLAVETADREFFAALPDVAPFRDALLALTRATVDRTA